MVNTHRAARHRASTRSGFTLIEFLSVAGIVLVLAALILPAILSAREAARRTECTDNMNFLSIAIMNRTSAAGELPNYGVYNAGGFRRDSKLQSYSTPTSIGVPLYSWQVELLGQFGPYQDILDQWDFTKPFDDPNTNGPRSQVSVRVFACPSDTTARWIDGGSSYVVNAGYSNLDDIQRPIAEPFDWNRNSVSNSPYHPAKVSSAGDWYGNEPTGVFDLEDAQATFDTGLMWLGVLRTRTESNGQITYPRVENQRHTLNGIYDGVSQTILLTENVNAGEVDGVRSWANPNWRSAAFVYPCAPNKEGVVEYSEPRLPIGADGKKTGAINGAIGGAEGRSPFPSSYHSGGCNFLFVDGSVKFLSVNIDDGVYGALVTPCGTRKRPAIQSQVQLPENCL